MLVIGFFQWWYGAGWRDMGQRILNRVKHTAANFSILILLKTLFLPWRRITTSPGKSPGEQMRALVDNAVSRGVGFAIRIIALLTAIVMIVLTLILGGLLVLIWPLLPLLSVGLAIWGLML